MCIGALRLTALLVARHEVLNQKYQANKKQLEKVVATLKGDAAHRIEIRHTLRVTWLLRLRACDLDDDAYRLSEDDDHARQWGGDFEHGIDWDLVHCHYELLVRARLDNIDVQEFVDNGRLNERALCDHLDEHGVAPRTITEDEMRVLGSMVLGSSMDELPDREGACQVKVCVSSPERAQIAAMRYSRQLEVMRDFVTWERSLHIQCCVVCGVMVVGDSKSIHCVSLGQGLVNPRNGGAAGARCGRCIQAETKKKGGATEGKWGVPNDMFPCVVPQELKDLTHVECMLIARYTPMMSISTLAKGGTVLTGNAIAFHQPLQTLASVLPRRLNDTGLLFVVRGLSSEEDRRTISSTTRVWRVRRDFVRRALLWCIAYCPPYVQDGVTICDASLNLLPEDGSVFDDAFGFGQDGVCDKCGVGSGVCMCYVHVMGSDSAVADDAQDLGPAPAQGLGSNCEGDSTTTGEEEESIDYLGGYDEESLVAGVEERTRRNIANVTGHASSRGNSPVPSGDEPGGTRQNPVNMRVGQEAKVDEKSPWFWTNCYPWLFPNGDGDITGSFRKFSFDVRGTSVCDYKSWCQQLMMFHDHRFTSDPSFVFHLGNLIQRMQGLSQSIQWNRRNGLAGDPSVEEIMESASSPLDSMLKSIHAMTSPLKGTNGYWHGVRRTLEAAVEFQLYKGNGLPGFFITGSCAEYHHPELCRLIASCASLVPGAASASDILEHMNRCDLTRRRLVRAYPNIVCEYFTLKTEQYIKTVLRLVWGVDHFFNRFEFAEGRGTIHFHGLFWRSDRRPHFMFQAGSRGEEAARVEFEKAVAVFLEELGFNCQHAGVGVDEWPLPEGSKAVPFDPRVLRTTFEHRLTPREAQVDLDTQLRCHTCSGYCVFALKKQHGKVGGAPIRYKLVHHQCRFGYGELENLVTCEGVTGWFGGKPYPTFEAKLVKQQKGHLALELPRNHPRILQQAMIHQWLWGANMDHSPIVSMDSADNPNSSAASAIACYVVAYECKGNPSPGCAHQSYLNTMSLIRDNTPSRKMSTVARTLMALAVGQRKIPKQQAIHEALDRPSYTSSFTFIKIPLSWVRTVRPRTSDSVDGGDGDSTLQRNVVDLYHAICLSTPGSELSQREVFGVSVLTGLPKAKRVSSISLYDFASCGKTGILPIGTMCPEASGMGRISITVPLVPQVCNALLRLHKPGYIWTEGIYDSEVTEAVRAQWVLDFKAFLGVGAGGLLGKHPACPPFMVSDYHRAKLAQKMPGTKAFPGEASAPGDISEANVEQEDSEAGDDSDADNLAEFCQFVSGNSVPDAEEDDIYSKPDWNILSLGDTDTDFTRPDVAVGLTPDQVVEWADEHLSKHNRDHQEASLVREWTQPQLLQANEAQRRVLSMILRQCKALVEAEDPDSIEPLHMIIAGTAGTGKSFLLAIATFIVQRIFQSAHAVRVMAASGSAADNVGGTTLHSMLGMGVGVGNEDVPCSSVLMKLQDRFKHTKMVAVDEMSLVGYRMLGFISGRLGWARERVGAPFGGIPIFLLLGDHGQLGPCDNSETRLCDLSSQQRTKPGQLGQQLYRSLTSVVYLREMKRQSLLGAPCYACPPSFHAPGDLCTFFGDFMARLRFGEVNDSDLEWAKGRHLSRLSSQEKALFSDAKTLFLVPKRADAHNLNLQRLQHFNQALQHSRGLQFAYCCPVRARDVGKLPKSIHEDVGGLPSFSVFCRGSPVTLCCNIVLPFRLFNGAVGTVVDFVFPPNQGPMPDGSRHPLYILVDFPDYSGPSLLPSSPTLVPIIPIEMHSFGCTRNGFPLKLSFCLTCHKAQGCTCGAGKTFERVCCNLGEGAVE